MKTTSRWPKRPTTWIVDRTIYISVPFTWDMHGIRRFLRVRSVLYDQAVIGGPGVYLALHYYPDYLDGIAVTVGGSYPAALQHVNPQATRTTLGCVRHCRFCGIGQGIVEPGGFCSLADWPDLPVLVDNNLLAAPIEHFDRVIDRLKAHGWADFEQGIDPRLMTDYHAERMAEIERPTIRLALDSPEAMEYWDRAYEHLRRAGVAKHSIRSYALIGFDSGPDEAWRRVTWIESHNVKALPMWFHRLDAMRANVVTEEQEALGWTDYERRRIMQWFYQHKEAVPA